LKATCKLLPEDISQKRVRLLSRSWPYLIALYGSKKPLSQHELAEELQKPESNVSLYLKQLRENLGFLVKVTEKERDSGGRPENLFELTSQGRYIIETIQRAMAASAIHNPVLLDPGSHTQKMIKAIEAENSSKELVSAAESDLRSDFESRKMWESTEALDYVEKLMEHDNEKKNVEAINFLESMLKTSSRANQKEREAALAKLREKFLGKLWTLLDRQSVQASVKFHAADLIKQLEEGWFDKMYEKWESLARAGKKIEGEEFDRLFIPYHYALGTAPNGLKESKRAQVYYLLNSDDPELRARALELHRFLYQGVHPSSPNPIAF
jgi:predicted ArsR family transcriptional regulator